MASVIKAGNATDGVQVTSDNTGILELKTGTGAGTTAVTIGTDQSVTFAGAVSSSGNQTVSGNLTVNGNTTLGDANTDTILMTAAPSIGGAGLGMGFGFRNRIINGAMVIDQRNAGASVTVGGDKFVVDRWVAEGSALSKYTAQQSSTVPAGFTKSILVTSSSAYSVAAGDFFGVFQAIEGVNVADLNWGTANAQSITVSFWVRSSLTGTFGGAIENAAGNRSYPFSYTISAANTFEYKTLTIPGDTTGTWVTDTTGRGLTLRFGLGVGSTYSGTAGSWSSTRYFSVTGAVSVVGTNGATFYITGVQLEKGSTATSFDYRPYGTELALCQRYYYRVSSGAANGYLSSGAQWYGSTTGAINTPFPVTMRTKPTALEQSGTANHYAMITAAGGAVACSAVPTFQGDTTVYLAVTNFTTASGGTAGYTTNMYSNNASAYLGWSAEL